VEDARQVGRVRNLPAHPEQDRATGDRVDQIDQVVHAGRQIVDVLPVDRRDEGAVQGLHQLVDLDVAAVLDLLDARGEGRAVPPFAVAEHLFQDQRRVHGAPRHGGEGVEEQAVGLLDAQQHDGGT